MKRADRSEQGALAYAFRLLAYRDRSEQELLDRLVRKGFDAAAAQRVADHLKSRGFIDDRRLAAHLRKLAMEQKHLGRRGAAAFLLKRGIPPGMVQETVGSDEDYLESAVALIGKMRRRTGEAPGGQSEMRRLWGLLSRRGFSAETIGRALAFSEMKEE